LLCRVVPENNYATSINRKCGISGYEMIGLNIHRVLQGVFSMKLNLLLVCFLIKKARPSPSHYQSIRSSGLGIDPSHHFGVFNHIILIRYYPGFTGIT
jgi:hypothetical protein